VRSEPQPLPMSPCAESVGGVDPVATPAAWPDGATVHLPEKSGGAWTAALDPTISATASALDRLVFMGPNDCRKSRRSP
jgi:hypothetical protein